VATSQVRSIAAKHAGITSGEVYLWLPESDHRVLAWYLYLLYGFAAPERYWGEPILRKYLQTLPLPAGFQFYRASAG
jgi:hypothetical protein